jgi:hypothetical protein
MSTHDPPDTTRLCKPSQRARLLDHLASLHPPSLFVRLSLVGDFLPHRELAVSKEAHDKSRSKTQRDTHKARVDDVLLLLA